MLASCRAVMAAVRPGIVATHYFNGKLEPLLTQQHQRITPCIYLASTASNFNCDGNNVSVTSSAGDCMTRKRRDWRLEVR